MNMPKLQPIPIKTKDQNFLTRIYRWITSIRKWEVVEDWYFDLPDGTKTVIPKGFVFDGASIPRPLWVLLAPTGLLLIPGLIHDFAYRYDYLWALKEDNDGSEACCYKYQENAGRVYWDRLFKNVGEQVNGMAIIDKLALLALLLGGWMAWNSNRKLNAEQIEPSSNQPCLASL